MGRTCWGWCIACPQGAICILAGCPAYEALEGWGHGWAQAFGSKTVEKGQKKATLLEARCCSRQGLPQFRRRSPVKRYGHSELRMTTLGTKQSGQIRGTATSACGTGWSADFWELESPTLSNVNDIDSTELIGAHSQARSLKKAKEDTERQRVPHSLLHTQPQPSQKNPVDTPWALSCKSCTHMVLEAE